MSALSERHISKRISKPNGMKAIRRIEKELNALLEHSPLPKSDDDKPMYKINRMFARNAIDQCVEHLVDLYT